MEDTKTATPREATDDPPKDGVVTTEETETKLMTWEDIETFFTEEGEWLEEQIKAEENSPYKMCPACSTALNSLKLLHEGLEDLDKRSYALINKTPETIHDDLSIAFLSRECKWYEASKTILMSMMQAAHTPHLIARVHPDLSHASRLSSFSRKNKTTKAKRKLERQRKTQARRKAT
jgi:hypothetical protein